MNMRFTPSRLPARSPWTGVCALGLMLLLPTAGRADILTFGNTNLNPLVAAGPQIEGNLTYEATVGTGWEVQDTTGNPASALATYFNGEGSATNDIVNITRVGGGLFSFVSVDTSTFSPSAADEVTISGFLDNVLAGVLVLNTNTASPNDIQTVASPFGSAIDRLEVRITLGGQSGARLLDNFNLNIGGAAAPEPGTLALLGAGLGMIGLVARRRSK